MSQPFNPDTAVAAKLERDPRADKFADRHGELVQYEVDAPPPETLRKLYQNAVELFWDADAHTAALTREHADLTELRRVVG